MITVNYLKRSLFINLLLLIVDNLLYECCLKLNLLETCDLVYIKFA